MGSQHSFQFPDYSEMYRNRVGGTHQRSLKSVNGLILCLWSMGHRDNVGHSYLKITVKYIVQIIEGILRSLMLEIPRYDPDDYCPFKCPFLPPFLPSIKDVLVPNGPRIFVGPQDGREHSKTRLFLNATDFS